MIKYALVTASTKGIGKAIATDLLKKGYYVFLNYAHDDDCAQNLLQELLDYKDNFKIIKTDLSKYESIDIIYQSIIQTTNNLDCIIFNAGSTCRTPFGEISYNDWQYVMDINLNMPFFILQKLDYLLRENGRIIFISTILGLVPHSTSIVYGVSKAAAIMLSKNLVKVFKKRKITVNTIAPGFIETPWHQAKEKEHKKRIEEKIALGRFGYPKEVATTCIHIIENSYINGAVLRVDGGYDME